MLLHFGAVDYKTLVSINGKIVGEHTGGYDAFSFDIPHAHSQSVKQHITDDVKDSTSDSQPRQAAPETQRHLVHALHRHLANRLA